jgi:hypothetical protein
VLEADVEDINACCSSLDILSIEKHALFSSTPMLSSQDMQMRMTRTKQGIVGTMEQAHMHTLVEIDVHMITPGTVFW